MLMERRRAPREAVLTSSSVAWLRVGDRSYPTSIVDECASGVGMVISQSPPVGSGQFVSVERLVQEPTAFDGIVRHLSELDDGRWFIGIEWTRVGRNAGLVSADR